jgi:hypothetical protein
MKFPISAYEKLLNTFLPKEFPEIEKVSVKKKGRFLTVEDGTITVHLKDYPHGAYLSPCIELGRKLDKHCRYLLTYFGGNPLFDIEIYYGVNKICDSDDFFVGKK